MKIILLSLFFISTIFANSFESDAQTLVHSSMKEKAKIIHQLSISYPNEDRLTSLFSSLLSNKLYYKKTDESLVYLLEKDKSNYYVATVFSSLKLPVSDKSDYKKVKTTNKLRSIIRNKLSELNLFSKDASLRLSAAKNLFKNLSIDSLPLIDKALKGEKNSNVKEILQGSKLILSAKFGETEVQKKAIIALQGSLSQTAIQFLEEIKKGDNTELSTLAQKSILNIESNRSIYAWLEKGFFGLSLGSILLLAAIGLSITFGVMKVINMAHGELIMIGAYTTFTIQQLLPNLIEYSLLIAIPAAFIVSAIVGVIIEYFVIRHLYSRPLETLLATFGISLILQQIVRSVYSPLNQIVETPQWMSGALEINSALSLTYSRLYIIIFSIIVFLGVLFVLKKTSLGLKVRAVTQNRQMAQAMGIKTGLIDAVTFGLGSGLAGIAGVALSQLTNVGPNLGQAYIVDSFMVVVFGGVGNLWGTFIGAMTIGGLNKFLEPSVGAILTKVLILIMIILFIQRRPRGLFPQKGRDAQD
ncbi:MAG: urea transport system permease protein [Sulfurimonas sp.]|jgi:urea transport system permease protein|uniref:urea ABC transporter permease subunit UrtB n=1 Tax=Sulfurimonas sp. TaxID=2022749 RepID=UPI0039E4643A